ncbi:MAG: hypothetical protein PHC66_01055 [Candidatus Nanoarchaeia archaeon]|nr:hypothetical protein [Candidatus Nanoarchaeia archaeon]MDD5239083.1 hypothetical protein [Candidatus Nanoarchaeia archaeon]
MKIWLAFFVIVVALVAALLLFNKYEPVLNQIEAQQPECTEDLDCVEAQCCHSTSCVPVDQTPNCMDTFCTMECSNGTMDCGAGSCKCVSHVCTAVMKTTG